jgi:hypothetical protein
MKGELETGFLFQEFTKEAIPFPTFPLILRRVIDTIAKELYRHTSADG